MSINQILKMTILSLSFFVTIGFAELTYNQSQLDQFERTNQCMGCDLSYANLGENHSQADLGQANLKGVKGLAIDLSMADLTNTNLTDASLSYSNFSGANFRGSELYGAVLDYSDLYQANITPSQLEDVSVCGAILPDGSIGYCK